MVLKEKDVVFAALEKNQPALQQIVDRGEVIAEQSAPRLANHILFDVDDDLGHLLADAAHHGSPRGLEFRQTRLDDVGLLTAFEVLTALAYPLLAFQDYVGELVPDFGG